MLTANAIEATTDILFAAVSELNDRMIDALYYADRSWGMDNTDDMDWCPVKAATLRAAADVGLTDFLTLHRLIERAVASYNASIDITEEPTLHLEWSQWSDRWTL